MVFFKLESVLNSAADVYQQSFLSFVRRFTCTFKPSFIPTLYAHMQPRLIISVN